MKISTNLCLLFALGASLNALGQSKPISFGTEITLEQLANKK